MVDRKRLALLSIRSRLKLEMKFPSFAKSLSGRHTMVCARHWCGVNFRTRKQALFGVESALSKLIAEQAVTTEED